MRVIPSVPAAIVAGAVGGPVFMLGVDAIEERFGGGLLLMLWAVVAFVIPVSAVTADLGFLFRFWRRFGVFSLRGMGRATSRRMFRTFYIPAWIRMMVWFVSVVVSTLLLKAAGLDL